MLSKKYNFLAILKIVLLLSITLFVCVIAGKTENILFSFVELYVLTVILNYISVINKKFSYIINIVLSFLFCLQQYFLFRTGNYIDVTIIENIGSFMSLGYKYIFYNLAVIILFVIIAFLPNLNLSYYRKQSLFLCIFLVVFSLTVSYKNKIVYSPYIHLSYTTFTIIKNKYYEIQFTKYDAENTEKLFKKSDINMSEFSVYLAKDKKPNIILLFSEGISSEVLDINNNLGLSLTPNLNKLYEKSIVFSNYYNHTAATYRALRGQIISGYQFLGGGGGGGGKGFGQMDKTALIKRMETNIISLIDILNNEGYKTYFVNSQPSNIQFSNYLETFNFYQINTGDIKDRYLSDREIFDTLRITIINAEEPFFIGIYNIGTHHGQDSPDIKYRDGSNSYYNKFHNYDAQFGVFIEQFLLNDYFNNTIIIFTTDHATFPSPEYKNAFKSEQKYFVSEIPLLIFYNGIEHKIINAKGRNSICLTPTILDILNIKDYGNYFLGSSLFLDDISEIETISAIGDDFYSTKEDAVVKFGISTHPTDTISIIKDYYGISINYSD